MTERKPKEYLSDEDIMDYHRETVATESEQSELRFTLQAIALWIGKYDAAKATIATLTAERDALVAAVRQTESVTKDKTDKQQASEWMMVDAKEWRAVLALAQQDQPTHFCNKCGHFGNTEQHEGCNYLAAQLKEQDDE
jgi:hypothetical protein